jgi:uncharacterized protein (TIGR02270 family)
MSVTASGGVLWDVAEEHLSEADFLVERWLASARSARIGLLQLKKTVERRLTAHLDALVVGGAEVADQLLWPVLKGKREGSRSAAALAVMLGPDETAAYKLVGAYCRTSHDDLRRELRIALKISPRGALGDVLRKALGVTERPDARAGLLDALAARRLDPGPVLATLLAGGNAPLLAAALRAAAAAAEHGSLRPLVEKCLVHEVPAVREAALRTGMIWSLRTAWEVCAPQAKAGSPEAMLWLAIAGGARDVGLLVEALSSRQPRAAALWALGFSGRVEAAEACLPLLDASDATVARLAGEAFAAITGLSIPGKPSAPPSGADSPGDDADLPPLEDDLKRDLSPVATGELTDPDAAKVRDWWADHRARFSSKQRYVAGAPLTAASLRQALREGPLRRTGPLACELAFRSAGGIQLPALHLGYALPVVPADVAFDTSPTWR